jgi:hypothetical protein
MQAVENLLNFEALRQIMDIKCLSEELFDGDIDGLTGSAKIKWQHLLEAEVGVEIYEEMIQNYSAGSADPINNRLWGTTTRCFKRTLTLLENDQNTAQLITSDNTGLFYQSTMGKTSQHLEQLGAYFIDCCWGNAVEKAEVFFETTDIGREPVAQFAIGACVVMLDYLKNTYSYTSQLEDVFFEREYRSIVSSFQNDTKPLRSPRSPILFAAALNMGLLKPIDKPLNEPLKPKIHYI